MDFGLAHGWVDYAIEDGDEEDYGYGIDVLHDVVLERGVSVWFALDWGGTYGNTVELHCAGLRHEVVEHLCVVSEQ